MSIKGFKIGDGAVQKYDYNSLDNKLVVDATLETAGAAADAKKTGDEIADLNYIHKEDLVPTKILLSFGTEKQPSSTSSGWKLKPNGSSVRDSNYQLLKYYLSPDSNWYINLSDDCVWQFQGSSNVPSGDNTDIKGYTHIGWYEGIVTIPSDANYLMVSCLITGSTHTVHPYTSNIDKYKPYINKQAQIALSGEKPLFIESDGSYAYVYMGSIYLRGSISKTFSISALGELFTLETSPSGQVNCIKIPYGQSLVYNLDTQDLEIKTSYTQYDSYDSIVLAYFSTSGSLQNGLIFDRWLLENTNKENIPYYFNAQINANIPKIIENVSAVGMNGFTFAFVTDQHMYYNSRNTPLLIKHINDQIPLKYVISGGDIIEVNATKEAALMDIANYTAKFNFLQNPLYTIMGNHDYNTETSSAVQGEDLTIQEFYGVAMRQMRNVVFFDDYLDYYFIDEQSKTGVICLQTGKTNGSYHLDQNVAIASILPEMPDNVIIVAHLLTKTQDNAVVTNANWNTLVNGSTEKPGLNGITGKSKIKCIIAGHQHSDWTVYQDNFRLIVCDTNSYKSNTSNNNSINELAFDVITLDYINETAKCVRFGRGNDRTISLNS